MGFRKGGIAIKTAKDIGIYIHIPFCLKKCRYCDFSSYPGLESLWGPYCDALVSEIRLRSSTFQDKNIFSIFIGGGTPSLIPYPHIEKVMNAVRRFYKVRDDAEVTIESNPGTLNENNLKAYRDAGINRISIGLQAYQDRLLKYLGRIHTAEQFDKAVFLAQSNGFSNINADIIFGIPNQTIEDWKNTTSRVLQLGIPHVSCYSLKIEEGTEFGRMLEKGTLEEADDELDRDMYHYSVETFGNAGLPRYEISNFAKPEYRCKHNMNYWQRGEYLGLGAAAHSFLDDERFANTGDVTRYIESVNAGQAELSERNFIGRGEALSESMILGLRLDEGIDLGKLSYEYEADIPAIFDEKLKRLERTNLVELNGTMVRLTEKGMDLANRVFIEFIQD